MKNLLRKAKILCYNVSIVKKWLLEYINVYFLKHIHVTFLKHGVTFLLLIETKVTLYVTKMFHP